MSDQAPEPPGDEAVQDEPRPPSRNAQRSILLIALVLYLLLGCMMVTVGLAIAYRVSSGQ